MTRTSRVLLWIFCLLVAAFVALPVFIVVPMSFGETRLLQFPPVGFSTQWYENFFASPRWLAATGNSLVIAAIVAVVSAVLGTMTAFALVRSKGRGRAFVTGLMTLPLVVPYVIFGAAVYGVFLQWGLTGTTLGFVIAHSVLAIPYVVVNVTTALKRMDPRLEMASASLGATPLISFARVTLPLILPGALAGGLFAFMVSFDEVVVAIFLGGPGLETLPLLMWSSVQFQIDATIAAVSTLLIGITTVIVLAYAWLQAALKRKDSTHV